MITVLILTLLTLTCDPSIEAIERNNNLDYDWMLYKATHNKSYDSQNEFRRRQIWENNLKLIKDHNIRYDLGLASFSMGVNALTDLTEEEYRAMYLSPSSKTEVETRQKATKSYRIPNDRHGDIDWRHKNIVTKVKDQAKASCPNSGWSFAAAGAMECQFAKVTRKLTPLSEQQLIDCSGAGDCYNGDTFTALHYSSRYGLEKEPYYRYTARKGHCSYDWDEVVTLCSEVISVPRSEDRVLEYLHACGPLAVSIDAKHASFQNYKNGIYKEEKCDPEDLNHSVLLVGTGRTHHGEKYWIVKNSYGTRWGMHGYMHISREPENQCGIEMKALVCRIGECSMDL